MPETDFVPLKIWETNAVYYYHLGITFANLGRFDEAEPELRTALKLGGDAMREANRVLLII